MQEEKIQFFSEQIQLRGSLYLPDNLDRTASHQGLIVCSGYTGLNAIYPRLFAQALTGKGFVVLGFDYRGCGESDGERGVLLLEDQVKDIRNSITFFKHQDSVILDGFGLLGWGMGAGLVIKAAEKNPDVKAIAGVNGFYDGESFLKASFTDVGYRELLVKIEEDKKERVFKGVNRLTDPFEAYPLDPDTRDVVDERLRPVQHYDIQTSFELAESIYHFDAITTAARLEQPLLIAHGNKNKLHPPELAEALIAAVPGIDYIGINGKHNDFMTLTDPEFKKLAEEMASWFARHL